MTPRLQAPRHDDIVRRAGRAGGQVIGQCMARHRHQEFIRFLNKINRETPAKSELHLIVDNYATHKHPKVRAWLERHKRFHFHFTPTSASWPTPSKASSPN